MDLTWFTRLHNALKPSIAEVAQRSETYLRLLSVSAGTAVSLAQKQLSRLASRHQVDPAGLVAASPAVVVRAEKGVVVRQLKLLDAAARASPDATDQVAEVIKLALDHQHPDVREQARDLLGLLQPARNIDPPPTAGGGEQINPMPRAAAPFGSGPSPGERMPESKVVSPVVPIEAAAELAELLSNLIEEATDPIRVERALHALPRFARTRPNLGVDVLVRRATELVEASPVPPFSGEDIRVDLAALTRVWLAGADPGPGHPGRLIKYGTYDKPAVRAADWSLASLVSLRTHEIARMIAQGGADVLSFPSRADGSIEPDHLVDRLSRIPRMQRPWPLDASLAAMRIPPSAYNTVTTSRTNRTARLVADRFANLSTYRSQWERVVGTSHGYRTNDPGQQAVTWVDTASQPGSIDDTVAAVLDRRDPLARLMLEWQDGEYSSRFEQLVAMWPLMLPHHPDLLAAHAHPRLNRGLTKNRSATEPLLDALARSSQALGPVACSALALGAAARNMTERTHAVDALVDLANRKMINPDDLAQQIELCLTDGFATGTRIAQTLEDVARVDEVAATFSLDALTQLAPVISTRPDASKFINVIADIATRLGRQVDLPPALEAVAASGTALAAAVRRVPRHIPAD